MRVSASWVRSLGRGIYLPTNGFYDAVDGAFRHTELIIEAQPTACDIHMSDVASSTQESCQRNQEPCSVCLSSPFLGEEGASGTAHHAKYPANPSYGSLEKHFLHSPDFYGGEDIAKGRSLFASVRLSMPSTSSAIFFLQCFLSSHSSRRIL